MKPVISGWNLASYFILLVRNPKSGWNYVVTLGQWMGTPSKICILLKRSGCQILLIIQKFAITGIKDLLSLQAPIRLYFSTIWKILWEQKWQWLPVFSKQCIIYVSRITAVVPMWLNFNFVPWIPCHLIITFCQDVNQGRSEELGRPGAIVSNHVSYVDILYHMSASFPSFVAKVLNTIFIVHSVLKFCELMYSNFVSSCQCLNLSLL